MYIGIFTQKEIKITAIFLGATRFETVANITAAIPLMDNEIIPIAASAARKLIELEEQERAGTCKRVTITSKKFAGRICKCLL